MRRLILIAILPVLILACGDKEESNTGSLALNFQLKYKGQPLVMFDRYEYPNGMEFFFTRFSFYLSNLNIKNNDSNTAPLILNEIDFLNLTKDHETAEKAAMGSNFLLEDVAIGDYQSLQFGIGVPTSENAMLPRDFPNDHPLASTGEYWDSWKSYIFSKTEGKLDTDGDGQAELGLAYHIGSDETFRTKTITRNFSIQKDVTTTVLIEIELSRMFDDGTTVFDPLKTAQIHSLTQIDDAIILADNLLESFK